MDTYIFYAFLLVLFVGFLIEGQRATSKVRPASDRQENLSWKATIVAMLTFSVVGLVGQFVAQPWVVDHVPGPITESVVTFVMLFVMFGISWYVANLLVRRSSRVDGCN